MIDFIEVIAAAAHMANRALCAAQGDDSQPLWRDAPDWQRASAIKGVEGALAGNTAEQSHESWLAEKVATGWKYGHKKDPEKKEHPCMVPYAHLPAAQQIKDKMYLDTVREIAAILQRAPQSLIASALPMEG